MPRARAKAFIDRRKDERGMSDQAVLLLRKQLKGTRIGVTNAIDDDRDSRVWRRMKNDVNVRRGLMRDDDDDDDDLAKRAKDE